MKKNIALLLAVGILASVMPLSAEALDVSAERAVLIEKNSGDIIYSKDANTRAGMASTTKIMTALVVLNKLPLDKKIKVAKEAVGVEGSSIYLTAGEELTVKELLYALLLESANDAAAALAYEVSGSIEAFADEMNALAAEMGLENTHFTNPHGLYDEEHYTTAYELALITAEALENEAFAEIVATRQKTIPLNGGEGARVLVNHNRLLQTYEGARGVKTGYTIRTGRTLVSAAERDGVSLIGVTLNSPDDWNDHQKMLDYGFEQYERVVLTREGDCGYIMPVVGGKDNMIACYNIERVEAVVKKEGKNITREAIIRPFYYAPVKKGQVLGRIIYYNNGVIIGECELIAQNDIEREK